MTLASVRSRFDSVPPFARCFAPALLALLVSAGLFLDRVVLAPGWEAAAQVSTLAERIRADDEALSMGLRAERSAPTAAPSQNDLLKALNQIALQTGIHLVRMAPLVDKRDSLEIELEAPFANVVQFIGQMEMREGILRRLQIQAPTGDRAAVALAKVSFLLDWKPVSTNPAVPSLAGRLMASVPVSDPLRSLGIRSDASLQAGHVLTGITRANGGAFATIDGHDYRMGDPVGDGTITAIEENGVQISSAVAQSWLRFPQRATR